MWWIEAGITANKCQLLHLTVFKGNGTHVILDLEVHERMGPWPEDGKPSRMV